MKKRILILALITAFILMMFALVACSGGSLCIEHTWEAYELVEGNIQTEICTNCGTTRRLCYPFPHTYTYTDNYDGTHTAFCSKCGISETEKHSVGSSSTLAPGEELVCDKCGAKVAFEGNNPPANCQHSYEVAIVAPTCLQDGYTTFTCALCEDSYITNIVHSEGHSSETIVICEPTCSSSGLITHQCTAPGCGYSYTESTALDRENGHLWINSDSIPFNAEDVCNGAKIDATCYLCKLNTILTIESNVEHEWVLDTYAEGYTLPTCEDEGLDTFYCATCGYWNDVVVEPTGHDYVKTAVIADCTGLFGDSYYALICSVCTLWDESYHEDIPDVPHTDEDNNSVCDICDLSTCEYCDDPDNDHICNVCSKPFTDFCQDSEYDSDTLCDVCGNNLCQHYGFDWDYVCDGCGENLCGHSSYCGEYNWDYDCVSGVYLNEVCFDCGQIIRSYTTTGHIREWYDSDYESPSCEEDGYDRTIYGCFICGCDLDYEEEIIPATGHKYAPVSATIPNCCEGGSITYECVSCGDTYTEALTATPHNTRIIETSAICGSDGYSREVCSDCGEIVRTFDIIPATNEHVNENDDKICDVCGASYCDNHEVKLSYDTFYHFDECLNCGVRISNTIEEHIDGDGDYKCDVCEGCTHSFVANEYDIMNHYNKCELCEVIIDEDHNYELIGTSDATCGEIAANLYGCTGCAHTYMEAIGEATGLHINVVQYFNAKEHWSVCSDCDTEISRAKHFSSFDDGSWADCDNTSYQYYMCDECDYAYVINDGTEYGCIDIWDDMCWECNRCSDHSDLEYCDANGDGVCDICEYCIGEHMLSADPIYDAPACHNMIGKNIYQCEQCKFSLKTDFVYYLESIIEAKIETDGEDWVLSIFDLHNFVPIEVIESNCGYPGYTRYECEDCGREIKANYVPVVGEHINIDEDIWHCDVCGICFCDNHIDEDGNMRCEKCNSSLCEWHDYENAYNHDYHWYYCPWCNEILSEPEKHYEEYYSDGAYGCSQCETNHCPGFLDVDGDNVCDRSGCGLSECVEHFDENGDYRCDPCNSSVCFNHVSDGSIYFYQMNQSEHMHGYLCEKCGEIYSDEICYDWDYDGLCDVCGTNACYHYDEYDSSWNYGADGYCDYCGSAMPSAMPTVCPHTNSTVTGHDSHYHFGYCNDCDKHYFIYHNYSVENVNSGTVEGKPCATDIHEKYTCDCGHVEHIILRQENHIDSDENWECDVCGDSFM